MVTATNNFSYGDVLMADLEALRPDILEQEGVRCNIAGTRCIIKWSGEPTQAILDAVDTIRNHDEALSYYGTVGNGWTSSLD